MIGKKFGCIAVEENLGEGAMGVVYLGHDTRLNRRVAVKVLSEVFATDPERKARLGREARLLATLSHPNIAAIYGIEEVEGRPCLVLELVEGTILAERLKIGRIPLEETLDICHQISDGLEAAHAKGIIHRDLKPSNIKVTPEGKVKILDLGLAKAFYEESTAVDPSKSPTITAAMTMPGVILGTAEYTSPEQAQGRSVDKRADIWAFGCIMYECLAGKKAFSGDTTTDILAAMLKTEPDWTTLPEDAPTTVRAVLRQCLQKNPKLRLRDIADVWIEIGDPNFETPIIKPARRRLARPWLSALIGRALIAGILIGLAIVKYLYLKPIQPPRIVKSMIKVEPGLWFDGVRGELNKQRPSRTAMALSNDGKFLIYCARESGPQAKPKLYLRRIDELEARPIRGTEGAINPFLSSDDK